MQENQVCWQHITNANPKIANYKFTTLNPNLGVASLMMIKKSLLADIPGLVEGAHEGIGLGIQFLKHIERCKIFVTFNWCYWILDLNDIL